MNLSFSSLTKTWTHLPVGMAFCWMDFHELSNRLKQYVMSYLNTPPVFVAVYYHISWSLHSTCLCASSAYLDLYTPPVFVAVYHVSILTLQLLLCQYVISWSLHSTCFCASILSHILIFTIHQFVWQYVISWSMHSTCLCGSISHILIYALPSFGKWFRHFALANTKKNNNSSIDFELYLFWPHMILKLMHLHFNKKLLWILK